MNHLSDDDEGIEPARLVSETTSPENTDLRQVRAFACEMAMASPVRPR